MKIKINKKDVYKTKYSDDGKYVEWCTCRLATKCFSKVKKEMEGKWYCEAKSRTYEFFKGKYKATMAGDVQEEGKYRLVENNQKEYMELYFKPYCEKKYRKGEVFRIQFD